MSPRPTELNYHGDSRVLHVTFEGGAELALSAEYLRTHSPSAEVQGHGPDSYTLQTGKEHVAITKLEPVGHYAVCIVFDDGHDTGIYSWDWLYQLGANHARNWQTYLTRLEAAGHKRRTTRADVKADN